jgi:hypothetical protein
MPIIYINKKHIGKIAAVLLCAFLLTAVCFLVTSERKGSVAETASNDETGRFFTEVSDMKSRLKFFNQFNIKIKPGSEIKDEITVPEKFNVTYKYYNTLQKQAGFNLEKFKGVKAERAVYRMKTGELVTILIYKGNVIAGHIESGIYGETYKPLTKAKNGKTR